MSTTIMAQCWPLQMPPTQKAVLISLADNANDQGECWPSLTKISERTCFGRTAVIDAIHWLEQAGLVVADRGNGRHTRYLISPANYQNQSASRTRPPAEPVRLADGTSPPPGRDQSASRTGPVRQADSNHQEPSRTKIKSNRQGNNRKLETTFEQWMDSLGDALAIPGDDPIFDWSTKAGIPDDFVDLAWRWFEDRYAGDTKRYLDWRAVFRNAVRGNWGKLWWTQPGGAYALTTIGEQYRRVRDAEAAEQDARAAA